MFWKISIVCSFIILLGAGCNESDFKARHVMCTKGNGCEAVALYETVELCNIFVDKDDWYCDRTDPQIKICRIAKPGESSVTSHCESIKD